jgi:cell filamentation protein
LTGYSNFEDPYCYKGGSVLLNKRGIGSAVELEEFEVAMFALRALQVLPVGNFDPIHYRAIHHHLFQDVYDWAGEYRTIRIAKNDTMFCYPEYIAEQMDSLFEQLQGVPFITSSAPEDFVTAAASFLSDLNAIHPFREGNGRTQLTFLFLLGHRARHALDMTRIRPGEMLAAMIASIKGKLDPLEAEIARLLQ